MPSTPPPGEPAPRDGALPETALEGLDRQPFGVYVHVPYCLTRCGYCDFNTYTPDELATAGPEASAGGFVGAVLAEVQLAERVLGRGIPQVSTIFFGGGTPTLLPPGSLLSVVAALGDTWGLASDVEITTEANPDSVTLEDLERLRAGGFTRISLGMQSAVPHVLGVLDRTHTPGRAVAAVADAHAAGFEHVNLDLIYGTPGESLEDWDASLAAVLAAEPDHVSAYALIVEEGTRLAAQIRRGELAAPDDDDLADKYLLADDRLGRKGLDWYEVSNWATSPVARSRHNELYWTSGNWWGIGPGAHSHVGGTRWWNVRHPAAYSERLRAGASPAQAREVLGVEARRQERILLELRLRAGLPLGLLDEAGLRAAHAAVAEGLTYHSTDDRIVLTQRGRLLADAVVRSLV